MAKKQQPKLSYGPNMGLIAGEAAVAQSEANLGNTFGAFAQGFQTVFGAIQKANQERDARMEAYEAGLPGVTNVNLIQDPANKQIITGFLNEQRDEFNRLAQIFDKTKDRGVKDQRFKLVPHDLDTVLDQGTRSGNPNLSIFTYRDVDGLEEFLSHPDIIRRYYAKFIDILENKFKPDLINPIIDRALMGVVNSDVLDEMKEFIVDRRRGVLEQIQTNYSVDVDLPKSNDGFFRTNNGEANFSGSFHVGEVKSIRVNGTNANMNPVSGEWELDLNSFQNGGNLMPGTNKVRVSFYGESDDDLLYEEFIKLWHDTGKVTEVSGELRGEGFGGNLFLTTRSSYIPKVPFLVRVDLRDADGEYLRDVWDDTAILSSNTPGVRIIPDIVKLRNGLGSVLVSVEGGGEAEEIDLISEGSVWSYLDNGSDQGVLWRGVNFDDSDWEKGRAELGYGDDDEVTELSFGPNSRNKYATTYFRSEFDLDGVEDISALEMRLKYDDGAIIYINGQEFFKTSNMEYGMSYDDYTLDGDDTPSENFQDFDQLTPNLLVEGRNVICLLYTSPSPRDVEESRMPSSA